MSASNEWFEYHLTPNGWVDGSDKVDVEGVTTKPIPKDRVLTLCFHEYLASAFSNMKQWTEVLWEHSNKSLISELQTQYGECPGNYNLRDYPMK